MYPNVISNQNKCNTYRKLFVVDSFEKIESESKCFIIIYRNLIRYN